MWIQTPRESNYEIKTKRYKFLLVSDIDVKDSCILCPVKDPYQQFLNFLFHEHIFRNSHSQVFFKIGALRNFAIFGIKKKTPTQVFSCELCEIFKNIFFIKYIQWLLLHFFKSNQTAIAQRSEPQQFFKEMSCLWRFNNFFFSTRVRDTSFDV